MRLARSLEPPRQPAATAGDEIPANAPGPPGHSRSPDLWRNPRSRHEIDRGRERLPLETKKREVRREALNGLRPVQPTRNRAKAAISIIKTVLTTASKRYISPDEDGTTFIGFIGLPPRPCEVPTSPPIANATRQCKFPKARSDRRRSNWPNGLTVAPARCRPPWLETAQCPRVERATLMPAL